MWLAGCGLACRATQNSTQQRPANDQPTQRCPNSCCCCGGGTPAGLIAGAGALGVVNRELHRQLPVARRLLLVLLPTGWRRCCQQMTQHCFGSPGLNNNSASSSSLQRHSKMQRPGRHTQKRTGQAQQCWWRQLQHQCSCGESQQLRMR